jgi:photosystem II stability/assembly factor-like uncharacterized protein
MTSDLAYMRKTSLIFAFLLFAVSVQTVEAKWVKQKTDSLAWLRTVDFVDRDNGRIAGGKGTYLVTSDGGKTWRNGTKFTSDSIKKLHFVDNETGWALCERDIYTLGSQSPTYLMHTANGGKTWQKTEFPDNDRRRISGLVFARSGYGIAIGEMGTFYGLGDDNLTWKKQRSPTNYLMLNAAFADEFNGAMVGGGGVIMFTEDAGASWNQAVVSQSEGTLLKSVFFANKRDGWAVGSKGRVFQTINGGRFWRSQKSGIELTLNDVYFVNNANGWAIGESGTILHSTTGGNVWRSVVSNSKNNLEDIDFVGENGWIVGFGGTILKWEPEGSVKRPRLNR